MALCTMEDKICKCYINWLFLPAVPLNWYGVRNCRPVGVCSVVAEAGIYSCPLSALNCGQNLYQVAFVRTMALAGVLFFIFFYNACIYNFDTKIGRLSSLLSRGRPQL